ncbi:hypothetical protein [Afifella marina]|uniref:Uncharacterized protein n=1 Tax=Afifella marina DSM 2698 TaxID=1120955 RepID=A0A1G5P5K3_AFIMA|nr:hypothetical protein [Afifella marina]SCZ44822.1 hypothetical protein SAMN03080610_03300 [Afifella marina DSM 2698]
MALRHGQGSEAAEMLSAERETNVVAFPACEAFGPKASDARGLTQEEEIELDRLRWFVLKSLLSSQTDLERACFVLAAEPDASLERFAIAFFRAMSSKARRQLVFYRPGTRNFSTDEAWLLRLMGAWRSGDEMSVRALISWRVKPEGHRWLRFLSRGLAFALVAETP